MLKISVVTVCYNAAVSIEQTMLSVLGQSYPDIEYIVIDGGSTDGTVDIIKEYADRLAYWVSEPDKGIYDAMNKGIAAATGSYINFMNAGDTFASDSVLAEIVPQINPNSQIVYGDVVLKYRGTQFHREPLPLRWFYRTQPFCHQSSLVKLDLMKSRPFNCAYKIAADYDFFYESYNKGREFQYCKLTIATYNATNGISTDRPFDLMREKFKIWGIENNWLLKAPWQLELILFRIKHSIKKVLSPMAVVRIKKLLHQMRV